MILKEVRDEWYQDYKYPSMFLAFPTCTFKCEKENGACKCQNSFLAKAPSFYFSDEDIVDRYLKNPITKAIVCGGLEPLDSWEFLKEFLKKLRTKTQDTVVIYTGYNEEEITEILEELKAFNNIVVKVGRYVPNGISHLDEILGITLASQNQYALNLRR